MPPTLPLLLPLLPLAPPTRGGEPAPPVPKCRPRSHWCWPTRLLLPPLVRPWCFCCQPVAVAEAADVGADAPVFVSVL
jgi:hypothetical protein